MSKRSRGTILPAPRRNDPRLNARAASVVGRHLSPKYAFGCLQQNCRASSPGVEPGLRPSQSRVRSPTLRGRISHSSSAPPRSRTSSHSFEDCDASITPARRFVPSVTVHYPDLESNQDLDLRRVQCDPLHHRDATKKSRRLDSHQYHPVYKTGAFLSRATSATNSKNHKARARGVEPRRAVLEAACSPRSTLVEDPRTADESRPRVSQ
jgi:hypothetical protein